MYLRTSIESDIDKYLAMPHFATSIVTLILYCMQRRTNLNQLT